MRRNVALRPKDSRRSGLPIILRSLGLQVTFLTVYVVPRMSDLFSGFGTELPTVPDRTWVFPNGYSQRPLGLVRYSRGTNRGSLVANRVRSHEG